MEDHEKRANNSGWRFLIFSYDGTWMMCSILYNYEITIMSFYGHKDANGAYSIQRFVFVFFPIPTLYFMADRTLTQVGCPSCLRSRKAPPSHQLGPCHCSVFELSTYVSCNLHFHWYHHDSETPDDSHAMQTVSASHSEYTMHLVPALYAFLSKSKL